MALNKFATIRYRVIDRCLRSKSSPYPSKERLRQACEEELFGSSTGEHISISTIEKDLWSLKNESSLGYAPIVYNKGRNGYYYSDADFSLDLPLNEEDIELIRLATNTLKQFKNSQVFKDLESSVEKIQGRLSVYHQLERPGHREFIRFETVPHYAGSHHLAVLLDAVRNQHETQVTYTPFTDPVQREYRVHPYFLQEHKNRWYLICYELEGDKFRTLGLDRLEMVQPTERTFTLAEDFNPDHYYQYSFGIGMYEGNPVDVILSFDQVQGRYVKAQPIHSTQMILLETEEELRISIQVILSPEFLMHLLSYGPALTVLSPTDLIEQVKALLSRSLSRY